jgi:hypothetical protein
VPDNPFPSERVPLEAFSELRDKAAQGRRQTETELMAEVVEVAEALHEIDPAPPRRLFDPAFKLRKWEEQGRLCGICGEPIDDPYASDMDHIVPHAYGGGNESANLQLTHASCNRSKRHSVDALDALEYQEGRVRNLPK